MRPLDWRIYNKRFPPTSHWIGNFMRTHSGTSGASRKSKLHHKTPKPVDPAWDWFPRTTDNYVSSPESFRNSRGTRPNPTDKIANINNKSSKGNGRATIMSNPGNQTGWREALKWNGLPSIYMFAPHACMSSNHELESPIEISRITIIECHPSVKQMI